MHHPGAASECSPGANSSSQFSLPTPAGMNYQRRVATRGKRGAEGGARVCKHVKMESGIVCFGLRSELGDGSHSAQQIGGADYNKGSVIRVDLR